MTNSLYQQLDDERKMRVAAVQTLAIAENNNTDLKKKLTVEEQAWKSANSALEGVERQAESQRKLAREASDQLAASKEQLAALKKQLKEVQRLRDQAKKARVETEEAKAKVERERDEAEQYDYDVDVAETKDALRAEVPVVFRAYCTQSWEKALNRAGIDASSKLRKSENIIFPPALQIPNQKEATPPVSQLAEEVQPQHPPSSSQQEKGKKHETLKDSSSDKVVEALQPGAAFQGFEKELASTTLPVEGTLKEKKKRKKSLLKQLIRLPSPESK